MNGDVLTRLNFGAMLDFHNLNNAAATMGVREYNMEVPYGVIKTRGNRLAAIVGKARSALLCKCRGLCTFPRGCRFGARSGNPPGYARLI